MMEIVEEEYQQFLQDMEDGSLVFGRYIDEAEYEYEYSHNDIEEAQSIFMKNIKEYLHINIPNKYMVSAGYCVFVITPERARKSNVSEQRIKALLVR